MIIYRHTIEKNSYRYIYTHKINFHVRLFTLHQLTELKLIPSVPATHFGRTIGACTVLPNGSSWRIGCTISHCFVPIVLWLTLHIGGELAFPPLRYYLRTTTVVYYLPYGMGCSLTGSAVWRFHYLTISNRVFFMQFNLMILYMIFAWLRMWQLVVVGIVGV